MFKELSFNVTTWIGFSHVNIAGFRLDTMAASFSKKQLQGMCPSRGLGVTGAMSALGQASIGSNIPGLLGRAEGGSPC